MKVELRADDVVAIVSRLAAVFESERDRLNDLDTKLGDGDHGLSMARGFGAARDYLRGTNLSSIQEALTQGGMNFNEKAGSTIGILMFSAMRQAGRVAADRPVIGLAELAAMLEAALEGIKKRGKAEIGQKTILDSLYPALETLRAGMDQGKPELDVVREAIAAAEEGAESTKEMVSSIGRARWFTDRSVGEIDPGAVSGWLIVKAIGEHLLGRTS
jgi:dihydroxyacetone kinase-like protein